METKDRILLGAQELFFKYGIKSVTMDDIAKHLAISKKTIYQFFEDKNEVVVMLMKLELKKNEQEFGDLQKKSSNVIEEIFHIMDHVTVMFTKTNPNVFYDLQKYHPAAWKMFKDFKEKCMTEMVERSIQKGIADGLVREDINPKLLAKFRIEQIEMGMNPEIFPPDQFRVVDVQVGLLDHFLHGICTLKGHKLVNKYKELLEEE